VTSQVRNEENTAPDTVPDIATARPVPWGGLVARLRAEQAVHRLLPAPLAFAALDRVQRLAAGRRPERQADARAAMAAVVGDTARECDLDELALAHLSADARGWEFMWRPWLLEAMPVEGLDRLTGIEPGRGIVFSTPHYGPLVGLAALPLAIGEIDVAVGEHLAAPTVPAGYNGYQIEQTRRVIVQSGFRPLRAVSSLRAFDRTLREGGRVLLNFDVPGNTPVQFLGKTVELKNGTARMAAATGAVIVPTLPMPRRGGWYVHVDDPVDPREHPSWESALQAVADVHTRLVLQAPEYLESPLRDGGWAEATAEGWYRKPRP
jgi:lauroyl/myristoyl acyltransferase